MQRFISLLRGINVSGQKKIKMDVLKQLYESLGFINVQTYIQSGNVIFDSRLSDETELVAQLENKISDSFGFAVSILIRTPEEFQAILDKLPFKKFQAGEMKKVYITFLSESPPDHSLAAIENFRDNSEEIILSGREIYLYCPNGYGRSKLSNNLLERKLHVTATTRNWKTVNTLMNLYSK